MQLSTRSEGVRIPFTGGDAGGGSPGATRESRASAVRADGGQAERCRAVLITDGEQRPALAIVRSLGRAGYRCVLTSGSGHSLAGSSRYAVEDEVVPDAGENPNAFLAAIERLVDRHAIDLVIPVTESSLLAILPARDRLRARIPFGGIETFRAVCDKARVLDAARSIGIRVPRQRTILSVDEAIDPTDDFPLVLKPHASVVEDSSGRRHKVGVSWARDARELADALCEYPPAAYPVLAQEVISGSGIGVFVLLWQDEVRGCFAHRRIREKPPSGGVSVVCQSEEMDELLLDRTVQLLRMFSWAGPAMVEYKRDAATGEAVLMEINGRFWGSLQLAVDSGVDFPLLLAAASFDLPANGDAPYRSVRSRWFWGDVDHLLARWRDPDVDVQGRLEALGDWLKAFSPKYRSETFRWRDPRPFFRETFSWFSELGR